MSDYKWDNDPSQESGNRGEPPQKKPWFVKNSSGMGSHPATWQGWVILLGVIIVIACIVILIKTHV
ncbi:MAG: hypothetical protein FWD75_08610 [Propionibacteriaceae bacterium]|nr:hypothetical protein [Propionibacteriaceae bacterium]